MLASLSPRRRVVVLAVAAVVVVAVLVGAALATRALVGTDPVPQDQPGPVLLVSGYRGDTTLLDPWVDALDAAGREAVVVPVIDGGVADLDEQAEALGRLVEEVLDDTGAPSVDVVGYSAGGVVARLWVREHGGDSRARRVLTVGSPHHGTDLAALGAEVGCPAACEQMAPDSDLLRSLNADDETPDGPRFVSVWSTVDQVVTPPATAGLEGALNLTVQSVCPTLRTAHGELPADPVVIALFDTALGPGSPTPPDDVECG